MKQQVPFKDIEMKSLMNPVTLQGYRLLIVGELRKDLDNELKALEDSCLDKNCDMAARFESVKIGKKALKKVEDLFAKYEKLMKE